MADEKPEQTPSAKGGAPTKVLVARLVSANPDDRFLIGHPDQPDDQLVITPAGVEIHPNDVEQLLEVAAANGVALAVAEEDAK